MKKIFLLSTLVFLFLAGFSQSKGYLRYDSVYIQGSLNGEMVILNGTRDTTGFLFNVGGGRTQFKRALKKLNDTTYLVGGDTLKTGVVTKSSFNASAPLVYNPATGIFSLPVGNGSIDGYISHSDWLSFTNKQNLITWNNVTAGSSKIVLGGTPAASVFLPFSIDINESALTLGNLGGTLPLAKGGTGAITQVNALNNLLPDQTGKASFSLVSDGANAIWQSVVGGSGSQNLENIVVQGGGWASNHTSSFSNFKWTLDSAKVYYKSQPGYVNGADSLALIDLRMLRDSMTLARGLIPTNTNQLTNGANFITSSGAPVQSVNGQTGNAVINGSETKVQSGTNTTVTGTGTSGDPYIVNSTASGGSSTFNTLTDVAVSSPANNQIPVYVSGTSKWTNTSISTSIVSEGSGLYWTNGRFDTRFGTSISAWRALQTSDSITEGTSNLYLTPTRVRATISGTAPLTYNSGTGAIGIQAASGSQNGYLASGDFANLLGTKNKNLVFASDPTSNGVQGIFRSLSNADLPVSGVTAGTYNNVAVNAQGIITGGSVSSYLTANQTITFNGDASGSGTTTVPIVLATVNGNVGSFGDASHVSAYTVNGKGLVTASSSVAITGLSISYDNIAALDSRAATNSYTINIRGFYSPNDGGGGSFYFVSGSTATVVPGMIIAVTGGRLFRLFTPGYVNVLWFGAKGDGVTDDAPAFKAATNFVSGVVDVPNPVNYYRIGSQIGLNLSNVSVIGANRMLTKLVSDSSGVKANFFVGYNTHDISLENMNIVNQDTATVANQTGAAIRIQMDTAFDGVSTRVTQNIIFRNLRVSGYKGRTAGIIMIAHRSGYGGTIRDVLIDNCFADSCGVSGFAILGEGGTGTKDWYYNIKVMNSRTRHTGIYDPASGFGVDIGGRGSNAVVENNYITDAVPIAIEMAGTTRSRISHNRIDSCFRTSGNPTNAWTFDNATAARGFDNIADHNEVLDSIGGATLILNQTRFTSTGNIVKGYTQGNYIDSVYGSSFTGDKYVGTSGAGSYLVWLRHHTKNNVFTGCSFIGLPAQDEMILAQDTAFNNTFVNCIIDGEKDSSKIVLQSRGAFNNIFYAGMRVSKGLPLFVANLPTSSSPAFSWVQDANGSMGLAPYGTGSRIATIDSAGITKSLNGIQIIGNNVVPQTASALVPGFISAANEAYLDSLRLGLKKGKLTAYHAGVNGLWSFYTSVAGDSLIDKKILVGRGFIWKTLSDSSRKLDLDSTVLATLSDPQTLANKVLTAPVINNGQLNSPILNSSSTATYVWTATDAFGHGTWSPASGGSGTTDLSQGLTAISDTIKSSTGADIIIPSSTSSLAGLNSAANQRRTDSSITIAWSGSGIAPVRASYTLDSFTFKGISVTASQGLSSIYTGNKDSISFDIRLTAMTTSGDIIIGGTAGTPLRLGAGSNGQVLTMVSGSPAWQNITGGGTMVSMSAGNFSPLFTTNVANPTTSPALTFTASNAAAYTVFGNFTSAPAAATFGSPVLASPLFANQGATNLLLHGNIAGNPSWASVSMVTDVTGVIQAAQFPALTGNVTTTAGSLVTTIANGAVTNGMLAGGIDLTTKVVNQLSGALGGTGINNSGKTITLGGNLVTVGAFSTTFNTTGTTSLTLPTSGTVLTTTGNGSGLSGIPLSISGTTNQVIASSSTGVITLSLPQNIGTGNAPIFTGLTLTGLGAGANTDQLVTISGGVLRSLPVSSLGFSSNTYVPSFTGTTNVASVVNQGARYIQVGNIVEVTVACIVTASDPAGLVAVTVSLPITTSSTTQNYIGNGTAFNSTTYAPVMVNNIASTTTANFSYIVTDTNAKAVNIKFMYSL